MIIILVSISSVTADMCPVYLYKQYKQHRPKVSLEPGCRFYLGIKNDPNDDVWYRTQPLGKNTLSTVVQKATQVAEVPGRKTGHSARHTCLQTLLHSNIPTEQVMQISGHRNIKSVNEYSSASLQQQQVISDVLTHFVSSEEITPQLPDDTGLETTIPARNTLDVQSVSTVAETTKGNLFTGCTIQGNVIFNINQK